MNTTETVRAFCSYDSPYVPQFTIITEGKYYDMILKFSLESFAWHGITPKWHPRQYLADYPALVERVDFMIRIGEPIEAWITLIERDDEYNYIQQVSQLKGEDKVQDEIDRYL